MQSLLNQESPKGEANFTLEYVTHLIRTKRFWSVKKLFRKIRGTRVWDDRFSSLDQDKPLIMESLQLNKQTGKRIFPEYYILTSEEHETFPVGVPEEGQSTREVSFDKLRIVPPHVRKEIQKRYPKDVE